MENQKKDLDNVVNKLLLEKTKQPVALFEELLNIWRKEIREENKFSRQCIHELNHQHNVDICLLGVQAIENGFSCWDVLHVLEDAIPGLSHNVDSIIRLLEKFYSGTQGNLAAGREYVSIEQLARKQPQFARHLVDNLLSHPKPFSVGYISAILYALSERDTSGIHAELLTLTNSNSVYVVQGAINALGRLNYQIPGDQKKLDKTLQTFGELSKKRSENIDVAVVQALGNMVKISEQAQEVLVAYAKQDNPQIHYQLSNALFRNCKDFNHSKWFRDCLFHLAKTSCLHKGIINNLDMILYEILQKEKDWSCVENFLLEWTLKSDIYQNPNEEIDKLFDSTISLFLQNKENLEKLITNFLNHDDHKVHDVLSDFMRAVSVHKISRLNLDLEVINSLDFKDILYICRKMLGYIFEPNLLCSLVFSILEKEDLDDQIKGLVVGIFVDFIGRNYPGTTIKFLKKNIKLERGKEIRRSTSRIIMKNIEEYQTTLKALPRVKELSPLKQQSYQIALEESKKMNKAMEKARKSSFIQQFATKIPLKYGTAWFGYRQGKYDRPTPLSSISHSIEIPRSEISHPVSAALERADFRLAKRGDR